MSQIFGDARDMRLAEMDVERTIVAITPPRRVLPVNTDPLAQ